MKKIVNRLYLVLQIGKIPTQKFFAFTGKTTKQGAGQVVAAIMHYSCFMCHVEAVYVGPYSRPVPINPCMHPAQESPRAGGPAPADRAAGRSNGRVDPTTANTRAGV